jgi:1-acyl-sn-glycerol-3-phosphate acyltransferase
VSGQVSGFILRAYTRVRSIVGVVLVIPHTALASVLVMLAGFAGQRALVTNIIRLWAHVLLNLFGIRVHVSGEGFLPASDGGILVFNHQSLFDIPVIVNSTDKHIRFGAKIELFSIPFFGPGMRAAGTLPIARENRTEVMRIYKDAEKRFEENTLFVLAPEGTRQKEPVIGRFKKGPFIFAISAGVPIFPVVLKGTHAVLPKKSLTINIGKFRRVIEVEYLPPISTKGLTLQDVDAVTASVREMMKAAYEKLPGAT